MTVSMIAVHVGRSSRLDVYPQWEEIGSEDIDLWKQATNIIGTWSYSHKNVNAIIECDFSSFIELNKASARLNHAIHNEFALDKSMIDSVMAPALEFFVKVSLEGKENPIKYEGYCKYFVERFLYDVFLVMNFSRPGVCDFMNIRIDAGLGTFTKLNLSGGCFESSFHKRLKNIPLSPTILPLDSVANWYRALDLGVSQKAETGVEKALFSVLHICGGNDADVTWVVWVFHALEAIYGTRVGEGFTNLVDRISQLLKLDPRDKNFLKRNMREMYDCRSSFVHGGYKVQHPMRNEVMDDRLNADYNKLLDIMQFGFDLVVLSLQTLITNDWYGIKIEERLSGLISHNLLSESPPN
ncbi:hypothetical protein [Pseudomonas protegens]|uniref:hypothetical protein n=1 Tax=Pseudomonas protegens TaxID=380021 RepID=UPI0020106666|nr:hypothetical protein [Pseudomonas protegens]